MGEKISYFDRFKVWVRRTLLTFAVGLIPGFLFASAQNMSGGDLVGMAIIVGLCIAALPATVAAWFLFLHMLRQASDAVRGKDE